MVSRKNTQNSSFESFLSISLIRMPRVQTAILCLCGAFPAPSLLRSCPLSPLIPDGTSFNIQNPIPHPSQKEKVLLETRRAKECQRGIAGAAERAKEGSRVSAEGSDTRLGAGCRRFESCHSDHISWKNRLFRRFFCVLGLIFAILAIVV